MTLFLLDRLRRTHVFPPKSVIQSQLSCDFPVVLEEKIMREKIKVRGRCAHGSAHVGRVSEQKIRNAAAGTRNRIAGRWVQFCRITCIESEASARTIVAVQQKPCLADVVAHLEGMRAANPREVVGDLVIVQHVALCQTIAADTAQVPGKRRPGTPQFSCAVDTPVMPISFAISRSTVTCFPNRVMYA